MAYELAILLVACLLAIGSFADGNVGSLKIVSLLDGSDLEGHLDYKVDASRALVSPPLVQRAELASVTLSETVCGLVGPTSPGDAPIISTPESTLVTEPPEPSPVPTTEQPPVSSGTGGTPADEPTSGSAHFGPSDEHTTTFQTSPSTAAESGGTEVPTGTSTSATSTTSPSANSGNIQGGMNGAVLALALTFIRFFEA